MTTPVILYGTQSNGETLPVQVDATGRLVAEGLQGQAGEPGPPGPEGPAGPNELLPYGEEGSYFVIENGVPTWTTTPPTPEPPGPAHDVMLVDDREVFRSNVVDFGVYNDLNALFDPYNEWDEACRGLAVFDSPAPVLSGIGGLGNTGKYSYSFPLKFNIANAVGKILKFKISTKFQHKAPPNITSYTASVSSTNANLTPINVSNNFQPSYTESWSYEFTYLCNRPDYTEEEFTFAYQGGTNTYGYPAYLFLQSWELMDSSTYLMQRLIAAKNNTTTTADLIDQLSVGQP